MLFDLFSWILITFVCYGWGWLVCTALSVDPVETSLPVYAMAGVAVVGVLGYYLSLAGPLHWIFRTSFFLVPLAGFVFSRRCRARFASQLRQLFAPGDLLTLLLTLFCLLIVLLISASPVIHPDTLNYHQFSVRIFADYGSLKGVVNARPDLGFQSSWFAALNIFAPGILTGGISFPLAGAVMTWFILFLRSGMKGKNDLPQKLGQWYALALLIFTMLSWTQIRLTAASASPDFITALNVMAAFYFFVKKTDRSPSPDSLACFFAFAALLTKLSAFPVLLIPAAICGERLRNRRFRAIAVFGLLGAAMLLPLLLRSYLESGYLLFPSVALNIFHPDWKMPPVETMASQEFIRAYARYPLASRDTETFLKLPFSTWGGIWWGHLYVIDKILVILAALGLFSLLVYFRRYRDSLSPRQQTGFGVAVAGVIFWFMFGPDPRFGSGFLLSFVALAAIPFFSFPAASPARWPAFIFRVLQVTMLFAATAYFIYRLAYHTVPGEWKMPAGIVNKPIANPDCTDHVKKLMFPDLPYGTALPDSCRQFLLRGKTVSEGFAPLR